MKQHAKMTIAGTGKDRVVLLNGLDIADFLISIDYHQGTDSHFHMVNLSIVVSELNIDDKKLDPTPLDEVEIRKIVRNELINTFKLVE